MSNYRNKAYRKASILGSAVVLIVGVSIWALKTTRIADRHKIKEMAKHYEVVNNSTNPQNRTLISVPKRQPTFGVKGKEVPSSSQKFLSTDLQIEGGETLTKNEEKQFFAEIAFYYTTGQGITDPKTRNTMLSDLNARYAKGVNSILRKLAVTATTTKELDRNIHFVDYLSYRLKFDEELRKIVPQMIKRDEQAFNDERDEAIVIAENGEILEKLAGISPSESLNILKGRPDSISRTIYIKYVLSGLKTSGMSTKEALNAIRNIIPEYKG